MSCILTSGTYKCIYVHVQSFRSIALVIGNVPCKWMTRKNDGHHVIPKIKSMSAISIR
jgi:hypothetical protein